MPFKRKTENGGLLTLTFHIPWKTDVPEGYFPFDEHVERVRNPDKRRDPGNSAIVMKSGTIFSSGIENMYPGQVEVSRHKHDRLDQEVTSIEIRCIEGVKNAERYSLRLSFSDETLEEILIAIKNSKMHATRILLDPHLRA